ncbi:MAG TPA: ScyD/ScyE family protein [Gammaproteobacteria bacterium]
MKTLWLLASRRRATSRIARSVSLAACLGLASAAGQAQPTAYAAGLSTPYKLDVTNRGALLVSEAGTAQNDGELSRIDRGGAVWTLLGGLPSGVAITGGVSGPSGVDVYGCCIVHLLIGQGDALRFNGPPHEVPNPVPSVSPIFSSVLRLQFDRPIDGVTDSFTLARADHNRLADGLTVRLENAAGERLFVRMVADVKDFRPDPIVDHRGSNPYAVTHGSLLEGLLIADAGQNAIIQAGLFGPPKTLVRFPPVPNVSGVGPPVSDAVPTSIRHLHGTKYLVSLLTGIPYASGGASVRLVDIHTGKQSTLISGLTTVTDVLQVDGKYYVLEISTDLLQQMPGRLLRLSSPTAKPEVVAAPIIGGSGMVYVAKDRAIYIAENFTGRVVRVGL